MPSFEAPDPELLKRLGAILPKERILARPIDRLARASDASMYRIVPQVVVRPRDASDVRALFEVARALKVGITLRTAGTSLSGQGVGPGILVDLSLDWGRFRIEDAGVTVWSQPGVVGGLLNRALAPSGRRIGPDPASIDAAMIGGIVANNASGMCCGVDQNSYRTIRGVSVVLADGVMLDTRGEDADERLRARHPRLHAGLLELRARVHANAALKHRIRRKFQTKNTMAYSLQSFLDCERPADILTRLMVGSSGTLGFLADVTLETVPDPRHRATALVYFEDLREAGRAVDGIAETGAAALEIMDGASLLSMSDDLAHPVPVHKASAALLVEYQEATEAALDASVTRGERAFRRFAIASEASFSKDAAGRAGKWKLRKGLLPRAGARRGSGLAILNEDVAFPRPRLAEAITDLHALFEHFTVHDAVVFGHARDGNLHFIAPQDFRDPKSVENYAAFMEALAELVVGKYDGALKAEHGAGRNMAPYVEREWGGDAYALMRDIKELFDPYGILNPGVILSDDAHEHTRNLKRFTAISQTADRCIECGFCEPVCPTRPASLTPRQRIVLLRELAAFANAGGEAPEDLAADYARAARAECVHDSLCVAACPVKIDTGALMKELDAAERSFLSKSAADFAASHFALSASGARSALAAAARLASGGPGSKALLRAGSSLLHALAPSLSPGNTDGLAFPLPAPKPPTPRPGGAREVVYFPACVSRIFGALPGENGPSTMEAVVACLQAAGHRVVIPEGIDGLCCGLAFSSQSQPEAAARARGASEDALRKATRDFTLPVVTDASPCALTFLGEAGRELRVFDFASYWAREVLTRSDAPQGRVPGRAVLHPTCSLTKLGAVSDFLAVAKAHAEDPVVPLRAGCCGFAGHHGFTQPEITEGATRAEAEDVKSLATEAGQVSVNAYSTCRTCEIGMTRATGLSYASAAHLVYRALGLDRRQEGTRA